MSNSTRKLLWFKISRNADCRLKKINLLCRLLYFSAHSRSLFGHAIVILRKTFVLTYRWSTDRGPQRRRWGPGGRTTTPGDPVARRPGPGAAPLRRRPCPSSSSRRRPTRAARRRRPRPGPPPRRP